MLRRCRCIVNVTLFSRATLVRKLQSTSDLDRFHTRDLPCSPVNSCDDPISNCRVGSAVLPLYIDYKTKIATIQYNFFLHRGLRVLTVILIDGNFRIGVNYSMQ